MSRQRAISLASNSGVFCVRPVIIPRPPAFETAAASSANPTKCIPPWIIGCSMPNISVIAVFKNGSRVFALRSMDDFEQARGAHAAADAHGDDGVFRLAPPPLNQGVTGKARTGHAVGMTDCNRTAVHVELFRIDAQLVAAIDDLHRESFVQFPEVDIVDGQSVPLEQPGHGI